MTRFSTPFTSCCDTTTPILRLPLCVVVTNIVFALVLLAAGCSSSSSDTTAETSIPTTTSTDAPTTTQATSVETTDPEPSVTTTPPAEWTPEELEIIEAHEAFRSTALEVFTSPSVDAGSLRGVTTAEFGDALVRVIETLRTDGAQFAGAYRFEVRAVEQTEDLSAIISICSLDELVRTESGAVVDEADVEGELTEVYLRLVQGIWLVDGTGAPDDSGQDLQCDLEG